MMTLKCGSIVKTTQSVNYKFLLNEKVLGRYWNLSKEDALTSSVQVKLHMIGLVKACLK